MGGCGRDHTDQTESHYLPVVHLYSNGGDNKYKCEDASIA